MPTSYNVILTGLLVAVMSLTACAAAKRPAGQWSYFHFDGHAFVAGRPADDIPFVAVQSGVRPEVLKQGEKPEAVKLAGGNGALAGICYIQRFGGKLKPGPAYLPYARMPVLVSSGARVVATVETDDGGYFLVALTPGRYRLQANEVAEITVESGTTTLVPLRAGKRMAD